MKLEALHSHFMQEKFHAAHPLQKHEMEGMSNYYMPEDVGPLALQLGGPWAVLGIAQGSGTALELEGISLIF